MNRLKSIQIWCITCMLCAIGVAACGTLAVSPQTFNERLVYTYETLDVIVDSTNESLQVNAITIEEAKAIRAMVVEAKAIADLAESASVVGDLSTAESRLLLAEDLLRALRVRLGSKSWEEQE